MTYLLDIRSYWNKFLWLLPKNSPHYSLITVEDVNSLFLAKNCAFGWFVFFIIGVRIPAPDPNLLGNWYFIIKIPNPLKITYFLLNAITLFVSSWRSSYMNKFINGFAFKICPSTASLQSTTTFVIACKKQFFLVICIFYNRGSNPCPGSKFLFYFRGLNHSPHVLKAPLTGAFLY